MPLNSYNSLPHCNTYCWPWHICLVFPDFTWRLLGFRYSWSSFTSPNLGSQCSQSSLCAPLDKDNTSQRTNLRSRDLVLRSPCHRDPSSRTETFIAVLSTSSRPHIFAPMSPSDMTPRPTVLSIPLQMPVRTSNSIPPYRKKQRKLEWQSC